MKTDIVSYYAQRASEYERVYAKPERQGDLLRLRRRLGVFFRERDVLEVSCGTGYWTEVIAPACRSVTACDVNEAVLKIARAKDWGPSRAKFRRADSYALPDFGLPFSGGFAGFWWSHVPKGSLPSFLAGFHALLSPGAVVAFIDNRYVEGSSTAVSRTDPDGNSYQLRTLEDGSVHEVLKNFPSREDLEQGVAGAAERIDVTFLEYYWMLSYKKR